MSRFDDFEVNEVGSKKKNKSDLSLEEVLRWMMESNIELIQIEGWIRRFDKTRGIAHRIRKWKNGIPEKE